MKTDMLRKRLFIALDLPPASSNEIYGICESIKGIRWTKREQLHLTLAFLGSTDIEIIPRLAEELSSVRFEPFELAISGTSFFRSKIFYLDLNESVVLNSLKKQIDESVFKVLGLEPSTKDFIPHITLARLKHRLSSKKYETLTHVFEQVLPVTFTVNKFILYESKTYSSGAVHCRLKEVNTV